MIVYITRFNRFNYEEEVALDYGAAIVTFIEREILRFSTQTAGPLRNTYSSFVVIHKGGKVGI